MKTKALFFLPSPLTSAPLASVSTFSYSPIDFAVTAIISGAPERIVCLSLQALLIPHRDWQLWTRKESLWCKYDDLRKPAVAIKEIPGGNNFTGSEKVKFNRIVGSNNLICVSEFTLREVLLLFYSLINLIFMHFSSTIIKSRLTQESHLILLIVSREYHSWRRSQYKW
jgi:hypothetical protein